VTAVGGYDARVLAIKAAYAAVATALVVLLLAAGMPLGAVAVFVLAVWLRRTVESGRLTRPI